MFAQSPHVSTTTLLGLLVISQESRNTSVENMGRRNGSVRNAQRSMQFNQIGRLTLKPVEQENIDVTVVPFSPVYEFDYIFDWTILKYQQTQRTKTQPRSSTPTSAPRLNGVAETCPCMKPLGKLRNIDLGFYRKLEY